MGDQREALREEVLIAAKDEIECLRAEVERLTRALSLQRIFCPQCGTPIFPHVERDFLSGGGEANG